MESTSYLEKYNLKLIENNKDIKIGEQLFIEPFLVPHRDEYSETVATVSLARKNLLPSFQILINGKNGMGVFFS